MNSIGLNMPDIRRARVENHALPVIVQQQESSIALLVVFHAEFYESLVLDGQFADQILDDAILIPLRKNLKSDSSKIGVRRQIGDLPCHLFAQKQERRLTVVLHAPTQFPVHRFNSALNQYFSIFTGPRQ